MRGWDERSEVLFSYVNCECAGSQGSSVAGDPADCGRGVGGTVAGIRRAVRQVWPAVDPARALASRSAVAGVLFGPFRDATDGTAAIQSAVPLVCRAVAG